MDIAQVLPDLYQRFREMALTNIPDRSDRELVRKVLLANGIGSSATFVLIILSFVSFYEGNFLLGTLDFLAALLLFVLLCLMRFRQYYKGCCVAGVVMVHFFFFYLFVTGAAFANAYMWYFTYPLFSLFLFGTRTGSLATILLFLPTLLFLLMDLFGSTVPLYDKHFIARFIPSFLTVFLLSYIYERSREKSYEELLIVQVQQEKIIEERTEKIREQQAQMAHAGRLTALGEMATGIAHEINQPLTIINLAAQYLQRKDRQERRYHSEMKSSLEKIIAQVKRASTIICNMRSFSRISGEQTAETDIALPVQTALSFFQEQFRIHQIAVKTSFPPQLPKVRLDSQKMEQVVVNLLSNARLALEERMGAVENNYEKQISIRIYSDRNGTDVVLEVEDNGIGMSPEVLEHCQEPFFTTRSVGQGTGLGLSILRNIVAEFNGRLEIESVTGQGSTFRIILPGGERE